MDTRGGEYHRIAEIQALFVEFHGCRYRCLGFHRPLRRWETLYLLLRTPQSQIKNLTPLSSRLLKVRFYHTLYPRPHITYERRTSKIPSHLKYHPSRTINNNTDDLALNRLTRKITGFLNSSHLS